MPRGRPTLYKPEFCEKLIEHMKKGFSFESFAAEAKVGRVTLYRWLEAQPDFKEAKDEADAHCLKWWEKSGMDGLLMGKQFNAIVWIMNMSNRFGWQQRPKEEPQAHAAVPVSMTDEQLLKLVDAARGETK